MNARFAWRMVRRESRTSRRRLALHMSSITLGVAALVAINSFRANIEQSIKEQARTLLGSDLEITSNRPFPDSVRAVLDSAQAARVPVSYLTRFSSMALAPRSGLTRFVQVRAMEGAYPYYGGVATDPRGLWTRYRDGRNVLVDPAVLIQLDLTIGEPLKLGDVEFTVVGTVTNYPGRVGLQSAIGPRIYIPLAYLDATNLIRRGSRAVYEANLAIPDADVLRRFLYRHGKLFERHQVRHNTVDETEDDLTSVLDTLARFLGLVGLAALLLGGMGVASAVHVYVKSRLETAALLRCLGARQSTVFAIYLAQATTIGLLGAAAGVLLGIAVQHMLPGVLGDFLPLDVRVTLHPPALLTGLGVGVLVAVLFALIPLLAIRDVPPLRALRRDFDPTSRRRDPWRLAALAAVMGSVIGLSLWQAPQPAIGFGFAGAIAVTAFALWATAALLMRATRRYFPGRARYVIRQGISNLFRPRNQTVAVTLALGFGMFLIAMLYVVQRNIVDQFAVSSRPDRPNLVMFDIQLDQRDGVTHLLEEHGLPRFQMTPIVPSRIAALNGRTVNEILDNPGAYRYERWALRRQYRHTYRDTLVGSEKLIAGEWWEAGTVDRAGQLPRISMERDIAADLNLTVGDRVTWNVQGVEIETEIASLRTVNWARFEPNFFVVFEPGVLDDAPQMFVMFTRADDPLDRARFQRDLVQAYPNVAALDLTLVQRTVDAIVRRVTVAIRFMAFFSIASGIVILIGALASSRFQRMRESVLLKTLGATARQVRAVLVTEYFALGAVAGLAGVLLAAVGGWVAMRFLFEIPFALPVIPLAGFWMGNALLTTAVGLLAGQEVIRKRPLEMMRELSE
ncbi:MAG: ABC transporter permease [Gemmatimonadetes bacterium]|nr:ABC transporter permease [Gemmatimonadota bacterium]